MKNVLLTGAARGLGLAVLERLISDGYYVVGIGRNETDGLKTVLDGAPESGRFVRFDLEKIAEIPSLVKSITDKYGSLYGLVNNAGIGDDGLLATQHGQDIKRILTVNLEAAIVMSKYGCRSMLVKGEGRIVNITSIIASTGFSGLATYAASKAGLEGFSRSLSRELGRAGVTVNCVAPGYMETDMTQGLSDTKMDSIKRRAPLGLARVEDAAGAVSYLLSRDASKITGSVITVDGGSTA